MPTRCKLCRHEVPHLDAEVYCTCGWRLDPNCKASHVNWCPAHGEESWLGAQEI
jgi:hypothetical protein